MIVVDVNSIAYLWIPGELTPLAEATLTRDSEWVSAVLWRSEFRNVLAGYLRQGRLSAATALRFLGGAEEQMAGKEYVVPSARVMENVAKSRCSAYDCEYVSLAEDLGTVLVTSDAQILKEFPKTAISLRSFARGDR